MPVISLNGLDSISGFVVKLQSTLGPGLSMCWTLSLWIVLLKSMCLRAFLDHGQSAHHLAARRPILSKILIKVSFRPKNTSSTSHYLSILSSWIISFAFKQKLASKNRGLLQKHLKPTNETHKIYYSSSLDKHLPSARPMALFSQLLLNGNPNKYAKFVGHF